MSRDLRKVSAGLLAALIAVCSAHAQDGNKTTIGSWNATAVAKWWTAHPAPENWAAGAETLAKALAETQRRYGTQRVLANEHFLKWMMHLRWMRAALENGEPAKFYADPDNAIAFRALGGAKAGIPQLLGQTLTSYDNPAVVAEILCRIYRAHPGDFVEYRNLAIAIAVVFDQKFPDAWPHPNVEPSKIPAGQLEPEKRFDFLVTSHRAERMLLDPRKLSVRELTFAIDTVVELKELAYAQQVNLKNPGRLEALYQAVPYERKRIANETLVWPHPEYRLIDVGKKGGICVDQAYFVSQTGKAQGVPTVLFLGQGRSGGHAWVGFLKGRGKWVLDAARYKGEDYPVGLAWDPQTWRRVTDQQLAFQIAEENRGFGGGRGRIMMQWAHLNPGAPFYREAVTMARKTMPRDFEPWELEGKWLSANAASDLDEQERFWKAWISNFDRERDMKARGQRMLLRVLRKKGDDAAAERVQKMVLAENRNQRFDLGIALAADVVMEKIDSGDWEEAEEEFESLMRRFQRNAGGHLFYNLLEPYVRRCLQDGRGEAAQKAMKMAERAFEAQAGSILDGDLRKLRAEVNAVAGG